MSDSAAVAPLPSSLWVYLDGERIGTLHSSEPLGFSYAPAWLAQTDPPTLHPAIPIGDQRIATPAVLAFFENLLPYTGLFWARGRICVQHWRRIHAVKN